jgi:pimeloyl-ACP methyl ester carboxylesterase
VKIAVEGAKLFFDVDGAQLVPAESWLVERPTVLLLHEGPGFDHTPYKAQVGPALAAVAQVVYLDFRGHGRSSGGNGQPPSVDRLADDVAAFCDLLEVERPVVLGRGLGSLVAHRLAHRHPGLASGLVLLDPEGAADVDVPVLALAGGDGPLLPEAIDEVLRFLEDLGAEEAQAGD